MIDESRLNKSSYLFYKNFIIFKDRMAGNPNRYWVIKLGVKVKCVGREVPLGLAKKLVGIKKR